MKTRTFVKIAIVLGIATGLGLWANANLKAAEARSNLAFEVREYTNQANQDATAAALQLAKPVLPETTYYIMLDDQQDVGVMLGLMFQVEKETAQSFLRALQDNVFGELMWRNLPRQHREALYTCEGSFNGYASTDALDSGLWDLHSFENNVWGLGWDMDDVQASRTKWETEVKPEWEKTLALATALSTDVDPWCLGIKMPLELQEYYGR